MSEREIKPGSSDWMAKVDADRMAAGKCRHCGGDVPCWSSFGDVEVGVRYGEQETRDEGKADG